MKNPTIRKYLARFFYPTDEIALREELKREIQYYLRNDLWPSWFIVPEQLNYQTKRQLLLEQYDAFIRKRSQSPRMPIALYYKVLLNEYRPDIKTLGQEEKLHFYNDYPHQESLLIWHLLYEDFPQSSESLEARWRIARDWAGRAEFDLADKLLAEAQNMINERLKTYEKEKIKADTFFTLFRPPADSAITEVKLIDLQRIIKQLRTLIGPQNRTDQPASAERLAKFVRLNPHSLDYASDLNQLLQQTKENDPLGDNILLAQAKLIADEQLRAEKLEQLHKQSQNTDGGMQALYELALLKISLWRRQDDSNPELKKKYLADARAILTSFITLYPDTFCAEQVKKNLDVLPTVE